MLSIETTAKTVKQAIEDGLKKLSKSIDEVEVKIISQPGIFRKAKVLITAEGAQPEKQETAKPVAPIAYEQKERAAGEQKPQREQREERPVREQREQRPAGEQKPQREQREDRPAREQKEQRPQPQKQQPQKKQPDASGAQASDSQKLQGQKRDDYRERRQLRQNQRDKERFDNKPEGRAEHREEHREHKEREYSEITDEAAAVAAEFVEGILSRMNVSYNMLRKRENGALLLDITSESGAIIGYRGETLDSIEYLASLTANKNTEKYYRVSVDCNGYRTKREEMLVSMATRLAEKAIKTQRKVMMEPMNNFSRKVVHSALASNDKIITRSEGSEPHRRIVIIPKRENRGANRTPSAE